MTTPETVVLAQGGVRLTPTMLSVGGGAPNYPGTSIASFRTAREREEITAWWVALALTGLVAFCSALSSVRSLFDAEVGGFHGGAFVVGCRRWRLLLLAAHAA